MMTEILAIDYGAARCGLALAGLEAKIAVPYKVVPTQDIFETIQAILQERQISQIVVGLPKTLTGQSTPQTQAVEKFASKLQARVPVAIVFANEGLSTRLASHLGEGRDDEAAALILATYLENV